MEPAEKVLKLYEEIKEVETEISKQMGNQIWDYAPALSGRPPQSLDLINLTAKTTSLIEIYTAKVQEILVNSDLPKMPEIKDKTLINFSEAMHTLYYLKTKQADMIFANYELLRIQTWLETRLFDYSQGIMSAPQNTFSIDIPGSIVVDENNNVDTEATLKKENLEHNIKTYLSSFPYARRNRDAFLTAFTDITTKGMVPRFYFKEMEILCERLLNEFMITITKPIYDYLSKGYTPKQAQDNLFNYLLNIFKNQNDSFNPELADLNKELKLIANEELNTIPTLEPETKKIITEELISFMIIYFKTHKLLPWNYYKLEIRKTNPKHPSEEGYEYVVDSYMLENDGTLISYPLETYAFSYKPTAKIDIFNFVTDGFVNPSFSLEDYLSYI